jgi:hypothetical protein
MGVTGIGVGGTGVGGTGVGGTGVGPVGGITGIVPKSPHSVAYLPHTQHDNPA